MYVYFSFVWFVYVAMCSPRPYTIYISYAYGTIWPICAESAVKHRTNKQTPTYARTVWPGMVKFGTVTHGEEHVSGAHAPCPSCPPSQGARPLHVQNFCTSYMRAHSMRNGNQILHGDQARCEDKVLLSRPRPLP